MKTQFLTGKERKSVRTLLRKAFKTGTLLARQTYYDFYDSCHDPIETPDAPFKNAREVISIEDLKAKSRFSIYRTMWGFELSTGYCTYEVGFGDYDDACGDRIIEENSQPKASVIDIFTKRRVS